MHVRASTSASLLRAAVAERVMIPAVDNGLVAMAADDGVAATTTTSRLWAAVAERVMATVAGSGVAATTATSHLRAATAEREMALAFGQQRRPAIAANGQRRRSVWWVFRAHPTGTPRALHYVGDCTATAV